MPESVCPICDGTGWRVVERAGLSGATRCSCYADRRRERSLSGAGIPPKYDDATLDNFNVPPDNPLVANPLSTVRRHMLAYLRSFPALDRPGLVLVGNTGVGKTHLAVSVLKELIARGHDGVFFDYQTLLTRIRNGWDSSAGTSDRAAYNIAMEAGVLVLDELGAHRMVDWIQDVITAILTHRCNHSLATIITTNLTLDDPPNLDYKAGEVSIRPPKTLGEVIGLRARSRLFEMCKIIKMQGIPDYREVHANRA